MSNPMPIVFTQDAARKVYQLITEEKNFALNLRVYITGGGCSGFQYGFTFDESVNQDDTIIERKLQNEVAGDDEGGDGEDEGGGGAVVKLLVDPMSLQYLMGAEIDYREDAKGAQFVIRNPNAKTTCGCGSSFSTS